MVAPTGVIFGALHLIPMWLSVFPSDAEMILWQVSTFFAITTPVIAVFFLMVANGYDDKPGLLNEIINFVAYILSISSMIAYAAARVILLVLCFTTLRSLPEEAFLSVEWTRFIPHF
jgi:hypothetical protein